MTPEQTEPPRNRGGRPRKPTAPRDSRQEDLKAAVDLIEEERDAAAQAYTCSSTVEAELRLLRAELAVSSAWAAYCRAQGNATHALGYGALAVKLAAQIGNLREIEAVDRLEKYTERNEREDALAKKRGKR